MKHVDQEGNWIHQDSSSANQTADQIPILVDRNNDGDDDVTQDAFIPMRMQQHQASPEVPPPSYEESDTGVEKNLIL